MSRVVVALTRLRTKAKVMLVTQRTLSLLAAAVAAVLAMSLLDYFLRFPTFLRAGHLLVGLIACGLLLWRRLRPAITFSPTLTDLALRVERIASAQSPSLTGLLATGVDFARAAERGQSTSPEPVLATLSASVQADAAARYEACAASVRLFDLDGLRRASGLLVLALLPLVGGLLGWPMLTRIALERTLAPWTLMSWPKVTGVIAGDTPEAFPLGTALPVRAVLTRTDRPSGRTQVMLRYRVSGSGLTSELRSVPMTSQDKRVNLGQPTEGELYERLLDPESLSLPGGAKGGEITLDYWFETSDDQSHPGRTLIVPPPAVTAAVAAVTPPEYAARIMAAKDGRKGADWVAGDLDATPTGPTRGLIGPVLSGSRISLSIELNKDLPGLPASSDEATTRAFLTSTLPGAEAAADAAIATQGSRWTLTFTATKSMRVVTMLRDSHGIGATDDAAFKLEVADDRPPAAAVIDPAQDEALLPTATLDVTGEGRDDVAIASVELTGQVAKVSEAQAASPGAAPEAAGEPTLLASAQGQAPTPGTPIATTLSAHATLSLASLSLKPGDEVWLTAKVRDLLLASTASPAVESPKRRLRIIAEAELIEQVRAELSGLREAAKRAEGDQSKLSSQRSEAQAAEAAASSQLARQQAMSERVKPMQEAVSRLRKRADRNQLNDESLKGLLKDASSLTSQASEASDAAADALDRLSRPMADRDRNPDAAKASKELAAAQQKVEDSLSELANMLDRGQDDWAVRRSIEKLLTQQQQLASRTSTATAPMQGRKAEELSASQKAELGKLATEQMDLSQKSQAMINSVQERAGQMQQSDQSQSQAMKAAADKARSEQLARKQEEASKQLAQNKSGEAQRLQQESSKTLQSMLEELDKTQQRKDESLRRVLADVQQSIEKLVAQQQANLDALAAAMAGTRGGDGLDAGMITLHQNTLGVQTSVKAEIKSGGERLMSLLAAAGEAQSAAITALRATPPDQPEADSNERTDLARLKDALEEARKLDDQAEERQDDRKRAELRKQYAELLELQLALSTETQPLSGRDLDRRQRAAARTLGGRQDELRRRMAEIRTASSELSEASLFDFAHRRYDGAAERASKPLSEGTAPASVARDQLAAQRVLEGLVAALDEAQKKKDDFKDDEDGGGGGGGGGGGQGGEKKPLIPPIAELKLLRAMQAEAAERTRDLQDAARGSELPGVADLQSQLANFAAELLKKIKQENQSPAPDAKERP
jgi:hypothetical protein